MNDDAYSGYTADNVGQLTVQVQVSGDGAIPLGGKPTPAQKIAAYNEAVKIDDDKITGLILEVLRLPADSECFTETTFQAIAQCEVLTALSDLVDPIDLLRAEWDLKIYVDPPDPNYMVIVQPTIPTTGTVSPDSYLSIKEADTINALAACAAQALGMEQAALTSLERAQGAMAAGSAYWTDKQTQAANTFAAALSALLPQEAYLRNNLQSTMQAAGIADLQITPSDVTTFLNAVSQDGLPNYLKQALSQAGADAATITQIGKSIAASDPSAIPGSLSTSLTDPGLTAANQMLGSSLQSMSPSDTTPTSTSTLAPPSSTMTSTPTSTTTTAPDTATTTSTGTATATASSSSTGTTSSTTTSTATDTATSTPLLLCPATSTATATDTSTTTATTTVVVTTTDAISGTTTPTLTATATGTTTPSGPLCVTATPTFIPYSPPPVAPIYYPPTATTVAATAVPTSTLTSTPLPTATATATDTAVPTTVPLPPSATSTPSPTVVPTLTIHNNPRTVVGGRIADCDIPSNTNGAHEPGCEIVSSVSAPGAVVIYTLTYADKSTQTFTDTADYRGHSLHPFNVAYTPPAGTRHGSPPTVAYITISATLPDGTTLGPMKTRFAVIR